MKIVGRVLTIDVDLGLAIGEALLATRHHRSNNHMTQQFLELRAILDCLNKLRMQEKY